MKAKTKVLFVCVENAERSLLAEALLRHTASDKFDAFSAGTLPKGVNPYTLQALQDMGISTEGLRSKSLSEFDGMDFDYVITLCDKSALECLALPHSGEIITWNFEDPVTSSGHAPFKRALQEIHERIKMFVLVKSKL